jgi:hypothetical protein
LSEGKSTSSGHCDNEPGYTTGTEVFAEGSTPDINSLLNKTLYVSTSPLETFNGFDRYYFVSTSSMINNREVVGSYQVILVDEDGYVGTVNQNACSEGEIGGTEYCYDQGSAVYSFSTLPECQSQSPTGGCYVCTPPDNQL